jgi:hypothetical protein
LNPSAVTIIIKPLLAFSAKWFFIYLLNIFPFGQVLTFVIEYAQ